MRTYVWLLKQTGPSSFCTIRKCLSHSRWQRPPKVTSSWHFPEGCFSEDALVLQTVQWNDPLLGRWDRLLAWKWYLEVFIPVCAQFVVEETRLLLCWTWLHVLFLGSKSSSLIFFFFLLRSLRHLFVNLILLHTLILMLCEQKQKTQNTIFNEKHYVSTDHEWHQAFTRALYCFVEGWNSIFNIFFVHSSCLKIYGRLVIFIINRFLRGPMHGLAHLWFC